MNETNNKTSKSVSVTQKQQPPKELITPEEEQPIPANSTPIVVDTEQLNPLVNNGGGDSPREDADSSESSVKHELSNLESLKLSSSDTEPASTPDEVEQLPTTVITTDHIDTTTTNPLQPDENTTETDQKHSSPGDDADDPLPSGYGIVSMDCCEEELRGWPAVLSKWETDRTQRPKELAELVRRGIPEALRGEVCNIHSVANCD